MKRWTIEELNQISDLEFARRILMERQRGLSYYSPLNKKLQSAIERLAELDRCEEESK